MAYLWKGGPPQRPRERQELLGHCRAVEAVGPTRLHKHAEALDSLWKGGRQAK